MGMGLPLLSFCDRNASAGVDACTKGLSSTDTDTTNKHTN